MKKLSIGLLILELLVLLTACAPKEKIPLVVFAAGSLIQPFSDLERAFEEKYPDIDVQMEFHGSIQVMRHVTDLHEEIDVVATADQALIPMLMYEVNRPGTDKPYTDWFLSMATNRLAIAYTQESKYANEITSDNWWEILSRQDVKVGLSDPRFDALGYRQLMIFALAQDAYGNDDIFHTFINQQFSKEIRLVDMGDLQIIRVPEILETTKDSHIMLRGSSIALISLLEAGEIDYAFEYESVIKQLGFEMLSLPPTLNLGEEEFSDNYNKVTVQMDFRRFSTVDPVFNGERITYGLTIPSNAPHPEEAALFIRFLYSEEGQSIMRRNAHPLIYPPTGDQLQNLPDELRDFLSLK
jgi:molybdate/tungstate transport system substrate-binding protein